MERAPGVGVVPTMQAMAAQWRAAAVAGTTLATRALGAAAIEAVQRLRCDELVEWARSASPFYRARWRNLPPGILPFESLPPVTRGELMAAFDDWCTDRTIRRGGVEAFLASRTRIGEPFDGRYLVWQSSGTTGTPGIFVQDEAALAVYDALVALPFAGGTFARCDWSRVVAQGGRAALVAADGDHFASIASWRSTARAKPWLAMRSFAVTLPVADLVAGLNAYQPALLASYPTVLALLADEMVAGRLRIRPAALWSGGESLTRAGTRAIEAAFGAPLSNEYGASECLAIASGCGEGRLHVNADWVILEPVDAAMRPTPPGERSHTVLLTNLANRVQPIVRYDLGDRVRVEAGPCACGNPLPALQVEGRRDDVLTLRAADGRAVRLVPLALATVVEESAGIHRFQIVQSGIRTLHLRMGDANRAAAGAALDALRAYLHDQGLACVTVTLDSGPPRPDERDGKLRTVIASARARRGHGLVAGAQAQGRERPGKAPR